MDSSNSQDDSYQKDSLLDLILKQKKPGCYENEKLSIDFSNSIMSLGMYKKPKQIYIQNTHHTKEIHISMIKDQRSISLLSKIDILKQEKNKKIISYNRQIYGEDQQIEARVQRVINTVRRKSCLCSNCGQQSEFEKRSNTFQIRPQHQIISELRIMKYNTRNQIRQQSLIRMHKIQQLQTKKFHISSLSTQMENQIQYNQTPVLVEPPLVELKIDFKKRMTPKPVVLKQYLPTQKNYFVNQYHITTRVKINNTPIQKTLPSLQSFTQSRKHLFQNKFN
ncbi:unnamed protein product [Paramecium primaurelia]|uniref:Uncharacterized protein n=1 Tax=Paramecium primaurelia TaxID=5886 RepID=A0A8S1JQT7_PARPR|nr:unnamed protein product [Paramecium primaurelia]